MDVFIKSGIKRDENKIPLAFDFRVENIGKSPAMTVHINAHIELHDMIGEPQRKLGAELRTAPIRHGLMLFPGQHFIQSYQMAISQEQMDENQKKFAAMGIDGGSTIAWPILYGCVSYRTAFDNENRITAFAYRFGALTMNDPSRIPSGFDTTNVALEIGEVGFQRDLEGFWAD